MTGKKIELNRFRQISVPEVRAALRAYEERFDALRRAWQSLPGERGNYRLSFGARSYRVDVEGGRGTYRVSLEGAERKSEDAEEQ